MSHVPFLHHPLIWENITESPRQLSPQCPQRQGFPSAPLFQEDVTRGVCVHMRLPILHVSSEVERAEDCQDSKPRVLILLPIWPNTINLSSGLEQPCNTSICRDQYTHPPYPHSACSFVSL